MPKYTWTLGDGKKWAGVDYESEDYSDALKKCEIAFNKHYCKNDMEKTHISCLDKYEHDGDDYKGVEYAVGLYCLGKCIPSFEDNEREDINIGLITDGKYRCGWFKYGEKYKKGLEDKRQIEMD